jgi:hypothetical protein
MPIVVRSIDLDRRRKFPQEAGDRGRVGDSGEKRDGLDGHRDPSVVERHHQGDRYPT